MKNIHAAASHSPPARHCFLFLVAFLGIAAFESNDISNVSSLHMAFAAVACFVTVMIIIGTSSPETPAAVLPAGVSDGATSPRL